MDDHGGRENGWAWRPRAWNGGRERTEGANGCRQFHDNPHKLRRRESAGQDWAGLGIARGRRSGDQRTVERCMRGSSGASPPPSSMAVSREKIYAAHGAKSFEGMIREAAWPVAGHGQYHLQQRPRPPCRAVPCRGGCRGCLPPFYVDFLGRYVAARGAARVFLDSHLPLTPATWQGA